MTADQRRILEQLEHGFEWEWHRDPQSDDVLRYLMEHGLCHAREDIRPGWLELTEKAKEFLMEKGWDPDLGARPLRRCIEHYVEDELAERMVKGEFHEGDTLNVDADGDLKVLTFTVLPKAEEAQALPGTDTL